MYLPECREKLWFSYGSAAGYGGYGGCGYDGYGGGYGDGYGEILTFVCLFVCEQYSGKKLLDGFRRNLVGGLGMVLPAWPLSVRGISNITACVSGPGLTLAAEHAGVSSVARHGLPARCRVDPGRSQLELPPLPGFCPAIVAVAVAIHLSHTYVPRRPDCSQPN